MAARSFPLGAALLMSACAGPAVRPPRNVEPYRLTVTVTGYCPCRKCCNWRRKLWGRPIVASGPARGRPKRVGITSSGTRAHRGTIAADLGVFPYGTVMYVPGYGYGRVEDTGRSLKGRHIDLFFPRHAQALRWGRRRVRVLVWPVRQPGAWPGPGETLLHRMRISTGGNCTP